MTTMTQMPGAGQNRNLWQERLNERIEEDAARDPVDAAYDAEVLYEVLRLVLGVVASTSTRDKVRERLIADLSGGELSRATQCAWELLQVNRRRAVTIDMLTPELLLAHASDLCALIKQKAKTC